MTPEEELNSMMFYLALLSGTYRQSIERGEEGNKNLKDYIDKLTKEVEYRVKLKSL